MDILPIWLICGSSYISQSANYILSFSFGLFWPSVGNLLPVGFLLPVSTVSVCRIISYCLCLSVGFLLPVLICLSVSSACLNLSVGFLLPVSFFLSDSLCLSLSVYPSTNSFWMSLLLYCTRFLLFSSSCLQNTAACLSVWELRTMDGEVHLVTQLLCTPDPDHHIERGTGLTGFGFLCACQGFIFRYSYSLGNPTLMYVNQFKEKKHQSTK